MSDAPMQSPLVQGFPNWDLLPAHSLLLRRRPALRMTKSTEAAPQNVMPSSTQPVQTPLAQATLSEVQPAPPQAAPAPPIASTPKEPAERTCPQCQAIAEPDASFCGECGARLPILEGGTECICTCGHAMEDHGGNINDLNSTACNQKGCSCTDYGPADADRNPD